MRQRHKSAYAKRGPLPVGRMKKVYRHRICIAEIVIEFESEFPRMMRGPDETTAGTFIYKGRRAPDIRLKVGLIERFPRIRPGKSMFEVKNINGATAWKMFGYKGGYLILWYRQEERLIKYHACVSRDYASGQIWMMPATNPDILNVYHELAGQCPSAREFRRRLNEFVKANNVKVFYRIMHEDFIHGVLEVIFQNFLLSRRGLMLHGSGIVDPAGDGIIFCGQSGAGKSTLARLYFRDRSFRVLNDDRIVVRNTGGVFKAYTNPWSGDFSDYLSERPEPAVIKKIFFIKHGSKNTARRIDRQGIIQHIYPNTFAPFWDKASLDKIMLFCMEISRSVDCYSLSFKNDESAVSFIKDHKG